VNARDRILVLTAEEMRAADLATVHAGTPVETLMERAGSGAVDAIERTFGTQRGYRVHVVSGTGNNGGDGSVVARLLAARGAHVELRLVGDAARLAGAARANYERLDAAGVACVDRAPAREPDLVVDAVLGTGARGALPPAFRAALFEATASPRTRVVALDLPTGLDADTGHALTDGGWVVRADLTVAFAHLKPAHVLQPGRAACGAIAVVDIGVEPTGVGGAPPLELATPAVLATLVPRRAPDAHKGDAGSVLVVGGSAGLAGAVALAGMSALRTGAGRVTVALPSSVEALVKPAMLEVMTLPLPDRGAGALGPEARVAILARAEKMQVVALGPGLSLAAGAAELARRLLAESPAPVVLDADGLTACAGRADELFATTARRSPLVVTPHVGEMARLTGLQTRAIDADRLDVARRFARAWDAVVVLKGAPTVVAAPDGRATVNATGNPGMATGGMGDVLTGAVAGFIAQGLLPYDAARLAVFVHGLAADLAHGDVGPLGLVAGDVMTRLPRAIQTLRGAATAASVVPLPRERFAPVPPDGIRSS
jgi:hydroxyethylthiazole kinase-like uncharacterized protein yjeF